MAMQMMIKLMQADLTSVVQSCRSPATETIGDLLCAVIAAEPCVQGTQAAALYAAAEVLSQPSCALLLHCVYTSHLRLDPNPPVPGPLPANIQRHFPAFQVTVKSPAIV